MFRALRRITSSNCWSSCNNGRCPVSQNCNVTKLESSLKKLFSLRHSKALPYMKNPSFNPHFQVIQRSGPTPMPMPSSHRFLTPLAFHASPGRKQVLLCISLFPPGILKSSSTGSLIKTGNVRSSLRGKDGTFSNVARLKASGGDTEFAENLEMVPVEVLIPKAVAKDGSLPARFINPVVTDAIPELRIHATAIVHPDAHLGEGVEIGAYCTVGPQVKLGDGCKLLAGCHIFGETQLGKRCNLLTGAVVGADIPGRTIIGDNNTIGHHAVVGVKCQDMKYKEGDECFLYIGNDNDIREYVSIHRSSKPNDNTVVGNNNLIMGSCHVAHDCKIGNLNILANGTLLGGHVVLEDKVHTGGGVAVHQFCYIGSYSFLAGGSMVDRDVPMFMMVAGDRAELRGLNLEGMRRCGFSDLEVRSIRRAYQKLFMTSDSNAASMEERLLELEQSNDLPAVPAVRLMLQSVRDCFGENRRGICRFRHWTTG